MELINTKENDSVFNSSYLENNPKTQNFQMGYMGRCTKCNCTQWRGSDPRELPQWCLNCSHGYPDHYHD